VAYVGFAHGVPLLWPHGGNKRFRSGAWRSVAEGLRDPVDRKRQQVFRTVRAPNNRAGEKQADTELAKLLVVVEARRTLPSSGLTVAQLIERYVVARWDGWSPGGADSVRARARAHINAHVGDVAIEQLRSVDIAQLYRVLIPIRGGHSGPVEKPRHNANPQRLAMRIVRRMPRMQVYLPDDLYRAVKERGLPASELLQEAVEAELRRQRLNDEAESYVAELVAEVGKPSARERARAAAIARRIRDRAASRAS
jgi:post-segregation antitoxin (ccd killing protein)